MTNITHIVVHYSSTCADLNLTVKDIDKMHRDRGWQMVGYHYVIRRDGVIERGRPESMVGAHVGGQNTGKIGICGIEGLDRATGPNKGVDNRTPQQIDSLIKLIRDLHKRYPAAKVAGHRDLAPTQCPGFDVRIPPAQMRNWAEVLGVAPRKFASEMMRYYDPISHDMIFGSGAGGRVRRPGDSGRSHSPPGVDARAGCLEVTPRSDIRPPIPLPRRKVAGVFVRIRLSISSREFAA